MQFRKEVQEQFRRAGWFEGRTVKSKYSCFQNFESLPTILKDFLYEYGELEVETLTLYAKGILDLRWSKTKPIIQDYIDDPEPFDQDVIVFPIGGYPLDNGFVGCSENGTVYMIHDYPGIMSHDFKEGIEKVIMEDYSGTKAWDEINGVWIQK